MSNTAFYGDGVVHSPAQAADILAIRDLAISYANSIDTRDWPRFRSLWADDATIDYTASGGIAGGPDEITEWMPKGLGLFTWCLHSIFTHEVRLVSDVEATGRVHVYNRNGVMWNGAEELLDIGGFYVDRYTKVSGDDGAARWVFADRMEKVLYVHGGQFADVVRQITTFEPAFEVG